MKFKCIKEIKDELTKDKIYSGHLYDNMFMGYTVITFNDSLLYSSYSANIYFELIH